VLITLLSVDFEQLALASDAQGNA